METVKLTRLVLFLVLHSLVSLSLPWSHYVLVLLTRVTVVAEWPHLLDHHGVLRVLLTGTCWLWFTVGCCPLFTTSWSGKIPSEQMHTTFRKRFNRCDEDGRELITTNTRCVSRSKINTFTVLFMTGGQPPPTAYKCTKTFLFPITWPRCNVTVYLSAP